MDIDLLSKMVKELILDRDKVVLPGLGAFVAEIVPSTFSDKGYTINPPYRRLFFRSRPDEGDDLISFYASSNNVELDIADKIIRDFVRDLKGVLHEKKTVVFPGLGRLRATKENHVFFVADENLDIYPDGFGLEPISLKTHQETAEEVSAAVVGLRSLLDRTSVQQPAPEPQPEPAQQPASEAAPAPAPEPQSEPTPEPMPEPAPVAEPEEVAETVAEQSAGAVKEPSTESVEEPVEEPSPVIESVPVQPSASSAGKSSSRLVVKVAAWIFAAAAVFLLVLAVAGRVCPDLIDPLLYSAEDMTIVKML